jgi:Uma2 family endonuclease
MTITPETITPETIAPEAIMTETIVSSLPQSVAWVDDEQLPGSAELPDSDDTPVDNEGQNDIPNGLRLALAQLWSDRQDWFFGVDMGIYDREGQRNKTPTIVPDGFLALGVTRRKGQFGRSSYVLAEEQNIVPILALEYLSKTYGGEYDRKLTVYAKLGVKYYLVYNPEGRRKHQKLELYELKDGAYERSPESEPFWLPELGLGIGRNQGILAGVQLEWLTWFDGDGNPYPLPEEAIDRERRRAERAQRRTRLAQQRAEQEFLRAQREFLRAQREQQRAEQEFLRAEREQAKSEQERQRAEQEQAKSEQERQRAEQERQRAEQEQAKSEQERKRAERLAAQLRALGIEPDLD